MYSKPLKKRSTNSKNKDKDKDKENITDNELISNVNGSSYQSLKTKKSDHNIVNSSAFAASSGSSGANAFLKKKKLVYHYVQD